MKKNVILASGLAVCAMPVMATVSMTAGIGQTDYELKQNGEEFSSSSWNDFEGGIQFRSVEDLFLNIKYRTALNAEHSSFGNNDGTMYSSNLDNSRLSVTAGVGMFYLGYLSYDMTLNDSQSNGLQLDYKMQGITAGIQDSIPLGNTNHSVLYGLGALFAGADFEQTESNNSFSYDMSLGYFAGIGIGGPISTTGFAYSVTYEYQNISFDEAESWSSAPNLEDTRSRFAANISYIF